MNRGRWMAAFAITALAGLPAAQAQEAATATEKPLIQTLFTNNDVNGWKAFGATAKVNVVKDETRSGTDKNVLQFEYAVSKGELSALILPVSDNEISGARSFRFSVRADYPTTIAAILQEKGGGRYIAVFHAPGGKWQNVVLSPNDFFLTREPSDPVDPNGKLDLDQVEGAGITDMSQIFAQSGDPGLAQLFNVRGGAHSLFLADFTVSKEPFVGALSQSDARLDSFRSPQIGWLTAGSVEVSSISGKPLSGPGISASYRQGQDRLAGLMRAIPQGKLQGKTALRFTLASEKVAHIVVQLEEQGGGKYNTIIEVPAGNVATPFTVKLSDLKPANDSKDDNGKFDPEKVKQVVLIDLSGLIDKSDTQNTLSLGDLRVE